MRRGTRRCLEAHFACANKRLTMPSLRPPAGVLDAIVVGSGFAGLATAIAAADLIDAQFATAARAALRIR